MASTKSNSIKVLDSIGGCKRLPRGFSIRRRLR